MPQDLDGARRVRAVSRVGTADDELPHCFLILGQLVLIDCANPIVRALLTANFGSMPTDTVDGRPELRYMVNCTGFPHSFTIVREGHDPLTGEGLGDLLFSLEDDIIVELQKRRPDLLFLHSAAVEWKGKAYLFAAESGSGKSMTTWGLLRHGFRYLSDELSHVEPDSQVVFPYPRALCLKHPPPVSYPLPRHAIDFGRTIHIPAGSLAGASLWAPRAIGAVFLVRHHPGLDVPALRQLSLAEASARLYVTALNPLAHPNHGLDAVTRVAEHAPCFSLESADLSSTCALIRSLVA
jgi:hypothetical protein